jgi:hypothetical protein
MQVRKITFGDRNTCYRTISSNTYLGKYLHSAQLRGTNQIVLVFENGTVSYLDKETYGAPKIVEDIEVVNCTVLLPVDPSNLPNPPNTNMPLLPPSPPNSPRYTTGPSGGRRRYGRSRKASRKNKNKKKTRVHKRR